MKQTRHTLLTSVIALVLCMTMFLGTTFAWFTDVVTSKGNVIQSGKLDVEMQWSDDLVTWNNADGAKVFDYDRWEPGFTQVKYIKVYNNGSLNLKWTLTIEAEGAVSNLAEVIDVYYVNPVSEKLTSLDGLTSAGKLDQVLEDKTGVSGNGLKPQDSAVFAIALHMDELAGNEYQEKKLCENGFSLKLLATQEIGESDSFGSDYDEDAGWPVGEMDFEVSASLDQVQTSYGGELTNDLIIRYNDSVYAFLPAGVKLADGVNSLKFSGKSVENGSNISLGEGDSAYSYDIHIEGIADDNSKPITVYLGKILEAGIPNTSLKLYHESAQMTRVSSVADFATKDQYTYDYETGEVVIYVENFSVFSSVQTTADEWDGSFDTTWYNENDTEFTLTTAEQLAGFRVIVDGGYYTVADGVWTWNETAQDTFKGKTVKLGADIDLDRKLFDPIGFGYWSESKVDENGTDTNTVFMGTFDGGHHTIYNLYQNCWELDTDKTNYSTYTYSTAGAGLFASIKNATIKNLMVNGAEIVFECVDMGVVVGYAQGTCHFENIVVTNAQIANYNRYTGGVVGEVSYGVNGENGYSHTFKNITVDSTVTVSGLWGSFGCGMGGVIGGKWGDATVKMENVISAPVMDVYNDVVSAYQWYAFRGCGMLIGHTEEPYSDGRHSGNATASFLTCENVKVYYGDWVNYHYYEFEDQDNTTGQRYPWVRAEAGEYCDAFSNIRYGVPTHGGIKVSDLTEEELKAIATDYTPIVFDQLYGADRGMYGTATHDGVTVFNKNVKAVYIHNNSGWTNLKLDYWYKHGDETWTNVANSIDISAMLLENDIYKIEIPSFADSFKITGDGEKETTFRLIDVANNGFYTLEGTHEHDFGTDGACICGCKKVTINILDYAIANNWSSGSKYTDIIMNSDISINASSGGNTAKYYTSGNNWRIYQSDNGTFTINSANGSILSVKIIYSIDNTGVLKLGDAEIESGAVVDVNKASVTFNVGNTGVASNGQVRITDIEVIYSTVLACDHKQTVTETKDPTCNEAGYTATKCADCGKVMSRVDGDSATGHSYKSEVTKTPTCTETGIKTYTCEICKASYSENTSATGHQNTTETTIDATCTEAGTKTVTCDDCGSTVSTEEIAALGHKYVDGTCTGCGVAEPSEPETPTTSNRYYIATIRTSGNYFYMTSNLGTASTKRYQAVDTGLTTLPESITNPEKDYVFVLIDNGDGTYSIQAEGVEGDNYLCWTSGNSGTLVAEANALKLKVDITNGVYNIHFTASDAERYLALNDTSNNNYFAWYKSGQKQNLVLIPVVDGSSEPETPVCEHTNTTTTTVDANCTEAGSTTVTCDDCGETLSTEVIEALGHTTDNGVCGNCGQTIGGSSEPTVGNLATFEFGANGSATHVDGNDLGTSKSYSEGEYILALTSMSKVYGPAYDAKGNSCIKLGTSKVVGAFSFAVPENVTEVVIYVAGYKATTSTNVEINGVQYNVKTASNNGEYTAITIDTTTTKTITFASVTYRCMIDSIVFNGYAK